MPKNYTYSEPILGGTAAFCAITPCQFEPGGVIYNRPKYCYMNDIIFELPLGIKCDGEPIIEGVDKNAKWYTCYGLYVEWYAIVVRGDTYYAWLINKMGSIVFEGDTFVPAYRKFYDKHDKVIGREPCEFDTLNQISILEDEEAEDEPNIFMCGGLILTPFRRYQLPRKLWKIIQYGNIIYWQKRYIHCHENSVFDLSHGKYIYKQKNDLNLTNGNYTKKRVEFVSQNMIYISEVSSPNKNCFPDGGDNAIKYGVKITIKNIVHCCLTCGEYKTKITTYTAESSQIKKNYKNKSCLYCFACDPSLRKETIVIEKKEPVVPIKRNPGW